MTLTLASATSAALIVASPLAFSMPGVYDVSFGRFALSPDPAQQEVTTGIAWIDTQMKRLRALPKNWDGYGAENVDSGRLSSLATLLKSYLPQDAPAGSIVPGADGSIQAEWHLRRISFGLLIEEGETVSAWLRPRSGGQEIEKHGYEALNLLQAAALSALG